MTRLVTENSENNDGHEDTDAAPGADTSEATEEARLGMSNNLEVLVYGCSLVNGRKAR